LPATSTYVPEFTVLEVCDRCRLPAQLRVVFPDGYDLLFCGHHARRYNLVLRELDVVLEQGPA